MLHYMKRIIVTKVGYFLKFIAIQHLGRKLAPMSHPPHRIALLPCRYYYVDNCNVWSWCVLLWQGAYQILLNSVDWFDHLREEIHRHTHTHTHRACWLESHLGRAIAQAVSRRPLTTEARFRSQVSPCGICGGKSCTGTGPPPPVLRFSPVNFIPPVLHYKEKQKI
jgi:hypothetical protein